MDTNRGSPPHAEDLDDDTLAEMAIAAGGPSPMTRMPWPGKRYDKDVWLAALDRAAAGGSSEPYKPRRAAHAAHEAAVAGTLAPFLPAIRAAQHALADRARQRARALPARRASHARRPGHRRRCGSSSRSAGTDPGAGDSDEPARGRLQTTTSGATT